MAPEQAAGQKGLTTAVDTYSLGAILYELLTGQAPFRGMTPVETLLQVRTQDPPRPRAIDAHIDRDLETICLVCLEKDAGRRYRSADALADDLARWLEGEPIHARTIGFCQRLRKWARRRPALATLASSLLLLAVCLFGLALWGWQNAVGRADALENARLAAVQEAEAREDARREAAGRALEARRKAGLVEAHLALERAMNHCRRDEIAEGLVWLAHGLEVVPENESELQLSFRRLLRGWTRHLNVLKQVLPIPCYPTISGANGGELIALSPNGKVLVTARGRTPSPPAPLPRSTGGEGRTGAPPSVQVWDVADGKPLGEPISLPGNPWHVALHDKLLVVACYEEESQRSSIRFWDVATRQPMGQPVFMSRAPGNKRYGDRIILSPDATRLVTFEHSGYESVGEREHRLRFGTDSAPHLWEVPTGKPIADVLPKTIATAVFSLDTKFEFRTFRWSFAPAAGAKISGFLARFW